MRDLVTDTHMINYGIVSKSSQVEMDDDGDVTVRDHSGEMGMHIQFSGDNFEDPYSV